MDKFITPLWSIYRGILFFSETFWAYFTFLVLCMSSEPMVMTALSFWHRIDGCVYVCSVLGEMIWDLPGVWCVCVFNKFSFSLTKYWFCCGTFICSFVVVDLPVPFLSSVLLIPLCWSSSLPHSTPAVCLLCGGLGCRWEQSLPRPQHTVSEDSFPMTRGQTQLVKLYRQELASLLFLSHRWSVTLPASQEHLFLLWCFLF